jgi:hypothetical protein
MGEVEENTDLQSVIFRFTDTFFIIFNMFISTKAH